MAVKKETLLLLIIMRTEGESYFVNYSQTERVIRSIASGEVINSPENKTLIFGLARRMSDFREVALSERARIALVIPYHPLYEIGGLEIGTMQISRCLKNMNQEVDIVSKAVYPDKNFSGITLTPDGIKVYGVGKGIEEIVPFLISKASQYDVIQWMEIFPPIPEDPDVYNDKAEQQYLASVLFRSMGKRVYLNVATSGNVSRRGVNNPSWGRIHQPFNALLRVAFTGLNYSNVEIAEEYKKAGLEINESRRKFIPFGVDTDVFKPVNKEQQLLLREELNLPKDKVIFFFLGRFVARKRPDALLNLWNTLSPEVYQKAHLVFIGGGASFGHPDSIYQKMHELISKSSGLTTFDLVPHELIPKYIQACDVMIFPSEKEGWPLALMEGMSCGKLVFASDIEGVRNIIDSPEKGFLFEPQNLAILKQLITEIALKPEEYLCPRENARREVISKYGWQPIAKEYLSFFRK